jgi:TPR repeat protein
VNLKNYVGRDAQFNMAVCTLEGWGVSRQRRKAAKWMRMAAKAGDGQAAVLLSTLQTPLAANHVGHPANIFLPCRYFPRDMVAFLIRDVSSCLLIPHSRGSE